MCSKPLTQYCKRLGQPPLLIDAEQMYTDVNPRVLRCYSVHIQGCDLWKKCNGPVGWEAAANRPGVDLALHVRAAIGHINASDTKAGVITGQKGGQSRDIVSDAEPSSRSFGDEFFARAGIRQLRGIHGGIHGAGHNGIYPDAVSRIVYGHRSHE